MIKVVDVLEASVEEVNGRLYENDFLHEIHNSKDALQFKLEEERGVAYDLVVYKDTFYIWHAEETAVENEARVVIYKLDGLDELVDYLVEQLGWNRKETIKRLLSSL